MAKVITVINQKGGVGRTTIAAHLAFAIKEEGHSTLFVDVDGDQRLEVSDFHDCSFNGDTP